MKIIGGQGNPLGVWKLLVVMEIIGGHENYGWP
jgi:hypothetical protein